MPATLTRTCPRPACDEPSNPRSTKGYCTSCMEQAKAAMKDRFAESKAASTERDSKWTALHLAAVEAGKAAAEAAVPTPMIVVQRANPFDDNSPIIRQYEPVMDGVCGFAWISIKPGNHSFALWLKKKGLGRADSYHGGVRIWVGDYGQSMERKAAYAQAYAHTLRDAGIARAYAGSRMD